MPPVLADGIYRIPSRVPLRPAEPPVPTTPTPPPVTTRPTTSPRPVSATRPSTAQPVSQTPDEAKAATAVATRDLADATANLNEIEQQSVGQPSALNVTYDNMKIEARKQVALKGDALSDAMAVEYRVLAQTTPPNAKRNVYDEQGADLAARPVDAPAQAQYQQAVAEGRQKALAAEPANLYEAQWQRNAQIWEAEQAQWDYEQRIGSTPAVQTPSGMQDPALEAQRLKVEQEWQDVSDAFAVEYRFAAHQTSAALPPGHDPLTDYRTRVSQENFDPRYRDRVLAAAQPVDNSVALETAIDTRVDAEVRKVEDALRTGGASAAFDALVAAKDGLGSAPITVPGSMPDDPVVLALAQQRLDERLRPIQEQIAAQAPVDLRALADAPAGTTEEKYARAIKVSGRLAQYTSVLPADLVPQVVEGSRDAWAPQVAFLGEQSKAADSSHPVVYGGRGAVPRPPVTYTEEFNTVVANFSEVGESLAASPKGDPALDQMATEFAAAIDPGDVGAFDEAFGEQGVGLGHGAHLAVQTVNKLAADASTRDVADGLLRGLKDGNEIWADGAKKTLEDFAKNRDELTHYIESFPGGIEALNACDLRDPADPTALELRNAVNEYLTRHPEVRELDAQLLNQIDGDGVHLLHLELALQGLSPEAMSLEHAGEVAAPVQDMLQPDDKAGPALWQIYASTPGVQAEMGRFASLAQNYRATSMGASAVEPEVGVLQSIASSQSFLSMPRNARFMVLELVHNKTGVSGLRTSLLSDSAIVKSTGVGFFGVAAGSAFIDAAGLGAEGLNGWDRVFAGARGLNYSYVGARDVIELGHMVTGRQSLQTLLRATGSDAKGYQTAHVALAKTLQLSSRGLFVVTDTYALVNDIGDGRNGGVITGDALNVAGSVVMLGEAGIIAGVGPLAAASAWAGPVAWVGTGLWTAGAVVKYQFDRVERSNRYETADQRRFLAHFGTLDDNGNPRVTDPNAEVEVSNATDHDPDIETVPLGDVGDGDIVYTGISADAVDELMNYSGSPDNPVSGVRALDALAAAQGVDPRRFYLDWFSGDAAGGLSHEQRKALVVAAQGVDPASAGSGISDQDLETAWTTEWGELSSGYGAWDIERVPDADRFALQDYVAEHQVVSYGGDYGTTLQTDPARLRVLLGLQAPAPGEAAPSAEVQAAAQKVLGDTAIYGREELNDGGFRPHSVDGLAYWMKLHGYPSMPGPDATCDIGARPTPAAAPPAAPAVDHEYTVQRGDNLWDIAERTGTPTDVWQLMQYHNAHNPPGQTDFDPGRADRDFFSPHANGDRRRDPDLIHPGETIFVADVADIRRA
jgi:LysM repeat protein